MHKNNIWSILILGFGLCSFLFLSSGAFNPSKPSIHRIAADTLEKDPGCIFNTVMGIDNVDSIVATRIEENKLSKDFYLEIPEKALTSINKGLNFLIQAQHPDGGWGAGTRQRVIDPHAVTPDPATTSIVAMSIMRSGTTFEEGEYSQALKKAHLFLMEASEASANNSGNITELQGTQIQVKLGQSIDAILTAQYFTNSLDVLSEKPMIDRTRNCLQICVNKIQEKQDVDGSFKGRGWAGLLQSSYANNALESAQNQGIAVKEEALENSRAYQKQNYSVKDRAGNTERGAGVMLYSVSSSSRASATEAKRAKKELEKAKAKGLISDSAQINIDNLMAIGMAEDEALKLDAADKIYKSSKIVAQSDQVMTGYGNNGGEEFLSFLQTGEGMVVNQDIEWKDWYNKISIRMIDIQEKNGSWRGHHCITSPVFCTATSILILSINNEIDKLAMIQ